MKFIRLFKTYSGLPREIYILFIARIVNCMGSFVFPFLTLFLTDKMGMGERETGMYFMISAFVSVPGSFIGGHMADRMGRKKIILLFQGLAALSFACCAFLGYSLAVPMLLILASFLNSVAQPANSAMLADLTNEKNRKQAFSLLYLGVNVGVAVGPLMAGFLYNNYIKLIFLGDALTTLASLLLVSVYVKESKPTREKLEKSKDINSDERTEEGSLLQVLLRRPGLLAFTAVCTIYSFVYSQHSYSITLQLKDLFGTENTSKMFGTIMSTNAIVVVVFTTLVTHITAKLKAIQNIILSGILFGLGFGGIYFARGYLLIWVLTFVWTLGEILESTSVGVYIANHTPMSHRGRFNAIIPIISGFGFAVGPYITGTYIENFGVRMVWPLTFILSAVAVAFMYMLYIAEKRNSTKMSTDDLQTDIEV